MLPVVVVRKYTKEGLRFSRFVISFDPHYGVEDECFPRDWDFREDPRETDWTNLFEHINNTPGYLEPDVVFEMNEDDLGTEVTTWAFLVGSKELVAQVERLKEFQLIVGNNDNLSDLLNLLKTVIDTDPNKQVLVWQIFQDLLNEIISQNTPSLIPYGKSEFLIRGIS